MGKSLKLILLLTGIFIAGGVTGGFIMLRVGREMWQKRPMPEQWTQRHLQRLGERLELKPEQMEQLRPIVRRNMEELKRLRNYSMAVTKDVFERMEHEVSEKLTPEQRAKYEQFNKEWHERAKKFVNDRATGAGSPQPERKPPMDEPPPPAN